jgi:hypothetical protein
MHNSNTKNVQVWHKNGRASTITNVENIVIIRIRKESSDRKPVNQNSDVNPQLSAQSSTPEFSTRHCSLTVTHTKLRS